MDIRFVEFDKYCKKCIHKDVSETEEPCCECLDTPAIHNSRKPINFVNNENIKEQE